MIMVPPIVVPRVVAPPVVVVPVIVPIVVNEFSIVVSPVVPAVAIWDAIGTMVVGPIRAIPPFAAAALAGTRGTVVIAGTTGTIVIVSGPAWPDVVIPGTARAIAGTELFATAAFTGP